jgi:hypothetical protein
VYRCIVEMGNAKEKNCHVIQFFLLSDFCPFYLQIYIYISLHLYSHLAHPIVAQKGGKDDETGISHQALILRR